jgi:hypothetical protein
MFILPMEHPWKKIPCCTLGNDLNKSPNVVIERLTLLFRFREVPGSNLGPETGYSD